MQPMKSHNTLSNGTKTNVVSSYLASFKIVIILLAIFWLVYVMNLFMPSAFDLRQFGIHPRQLDGLSGILFSPFLHGNLIHIISNTVPFLILGGLVSLRGRREYALITFLIIVIGGAGVWCFARGQTNHIGASGLIFGYFGFLLAAGWFERKWSSIIIAVVVAIFYGSMIFGVLPTKTYISFEAHLCGFLSGILTSFILKKQMIENT